jgi:hypothetical protein
MTLNERIKHWRDLGYTERTDFAGEYILLTHPETWARVRIYPGHELHRELCTDYTLVKETP